MVVMCLKCNKIYEENYDKCPHCKRDNYMKYKRRNVDDRES